VSQVHYYLTSMTTLLPGLFAGIGVFQWLAGRQPRPADEHARCGNCGYILTGLVEPRCPECGKPTG
jgi:hypothetical protein